MTKPIRLITAACLTLSLTCSAVCSQNLRIVSGQKIAFLGDSITQAGARGTAGYCKLVIRGLALHGKKVQMIAAGKSGHKSNQMLARLDKDVIQKKPDWMTLSCGVNDVWHRKKGVPLPEYKENITAIVDRAQEAGIRVMILTSTMIKEDPKNELNGQLAGYNAFLRRLAKDKNCILADLNATMQAAIVNGPKMKGNLLTTDGVHMNALGNIMMALGVLEAFGLDEKQLAKCSADFDAISDICSVRLDTKLSPASYRKLQERAAAQGVSVRDLLAPALQARVEELLRAK